VRPQGRLRINAPVSFGLLHLASRWPAFTRRHPNVELDVSLIDRVVDVVDEGYDMAIRISRAGSSTHAARKLATSRNVICASPEYLREHGSPGTPADLARHACIVYAYVGGEWHLQDDAGKSHSVRVRSVMQANNGDTARIAALSGLGIIWQPTFLIGPDLRAGRLVPLLPGWRVPDIDILAVYPSRRHLSAKVRAMIDFLAEEFSGTPPWDRD
jgi:DNA-binding transcriptional LysR family regulator